MTDTITSQIIDLSYQIILYTSACLAAIWHSHDSGLASNKSSV